MIPLVGARWDDAAQSPRFGRAIDFGLIDFIEVNFPISRSEDPTALGVPLYAHTSNNPLSSAHGLDYRLAQQVRISADAAGSPWIGEHLSWLSPAPSGALGYVINPLLTREFEEISSRNARALQHFYQRPVALEFGPVYWTNEGETNELEFLNSVATRADCAIILDIAHYLVGIRNTGRRPYSGLDALDPSRVVELHVAGTRRGSDGFWHDAHGALPDAETLAMLRNCLKLYPGVRAVTFEHDLAAPEDAFFEGIREIRNEMELA